MLSGMAFLDSSNTNSIESFAAPYLCWIATAKSCTQMSLFHGQLLLDGNLPMSNNSEVKDTVRNQAYPVGGVGSCS